MAFFEHARHRCVVLGRGDHEGVRLLETAAQLLGARGKAPLALLVSVVR